ncbi:hypothetical protein AB9F35_35410, partial [Rhizobium leguminosarum]|uniref:hypothetical protein n=1 Tax=Rhizobium leguminosarum TaxID=384 RepID=UPI003F99F4DA
KRHAQQIDFLGPCRSQPGFVHDDFVDFDLAGALEAQLHSYRRVVSLLRGRHVEIVDTYDGGKPAVLSLMTCLAPTAGPDRI